jgi:peptidoglycan/xylan/chitin deacetylase (PgdA/CDA1 family)
VGTDDDRRLSCCLTFDFDAMSAWIGSFRSENPSMISRGEFGATVGLPHVLDLLAKHNIRSTFCVPGHTAHAYPGLVHRILEKGHELVHHGWVHENPADFDREGEKRNLERGLEALGRAGGRSPQGLPLAGLGLQPEHRGTADRVRLQVRLQLHGQRLLPLLPAQRGPMVHHGALLLRTSSGCRTRWRSSMT